MLKDLSGIGALHDALATTNSLLADVLAELKETNAVRLEAIAEAVRAIDVAASKSDSLS